MLKHFTFRILMSLTELRNNLLLPFYERLLISFLVDCLLTDDIIFNYHYLNSHFTYASFDQVSKTLVNMIMLPWQVSVLLQTGWKIKIACKLCVGWRSCFMIFCLSRVFVYFIFHYTFCFIPIIEDMSLCNLNFSEFWE